MRQMIKLITQMQRKYFKTLSCHLPSKFVKGEAFVSELENLISSASPRLSAPFFLWSFAKVLDSSSLKKRYTYKQKKEVNYLSFKYAEIKKYMASKSQAE